MHSWKKPDSWPNQSLLAGRTGGLLHPCCTSNSYRFCFTPGLCKQTLSNSNYSTQEMAHNLRYCQLIDFSFFSFFLETCIFKYSVDFVLWKSFYRFWSHLSKAEKCPCFSKQIMIFSFGTHLTIVFGMNKKHIFLFTFYSTHWKYNKIILRWNILRKFWEKKNIIKNI